MSDPSSQIVDADQFAIVEHVPPGRSDLMAFAGKTNPAAVYTNIPQDRKHVGLLVNACSQKDKYAKEVVGQVLAIRYYFAHLVERTDQKTGENWTGWRVVLIDVTGRLIACSGPAIKRAVEQIALIAGNGPWEPPVYCEIIANPTAGGNTYHTLRMVDEPQKPPTATPVRSK